MSFFTLCFTFKYYILLKLTGITSVILKITKKKLIKKHNLGYVKSTKIGVTYILKSKKQFQTELKAIQDERRIIQAMNKNKMGEINYFSI